MLCTGSGCEDPWCRALFSLNILYHKCTVDDVVPSPVVLIMLTVVFGFL